ncbi:hypothetical protein NKH77_54985 [Streptomyces sp. M19]
MTQEHHVFHGTLRDNLLIARPEAADRELDEALAVVGAGSGPANWAWTPRWDPVPPRSPRPAPSNWPSPGWSWPIRTPWSWTRRRRCSPARRPRPGTGPGRRAQGPHRDRHRPPPAHGPRRGPRRGHGGGPDHRERGHHELVERAARTPGSGSPGTASGTASGTARRRRRPARRPTTARPRPLRTPRPGNPRTARPRPTDRGPARGTAPGAPGGQDRPREDGPPRRAKVRVETMHGTEPSGTEPCRTHADDDETGPFSPPTGPGSPPGNTPPGPRPRR